MRKSIRGKDISETKRVLDYTKDGYVVLHPSRIYKNYSQGKLYIVNPQIVKRKYKDTKESTRKYYNKLVSRWKDLKKNSIDFEYEQCALCNRDGEEFHHENYNEPFVGIFLCRGCHTRLHKRIKRNTNIYSIVCSYMGMCRVQMRKLGIRLNSY